MDYKEKFTRIYGAGGEEAYKEFLVHTGEGFDSLDSEQQEKIFYDFIGERDKRLRETALRGAAISIMTAGPQVPLSDSPLVRKIKEYKI